MLRKLFASKSYNVFGLILLLIISMMVLVEIKNDKFWLNDFKVFYQACQAFLSDQPIYGVSFGLDTGFYKYAPFTLILFLPFQALPYFTACLLHIFCITIATWFTFRGTALLFEPQKRLRLGTLILAFLIIAVLLTREIHLGNVNMILIALLVLTLLLYHRSKIFLASLCWSIVILTKPYMILLGWPFLLQREFRFLLFSIVNTIVLIGISAIFFGKNTFEMYQSWINAMASHSGYLESHQTIFAIFNKATGVATSVFWTYLILILTIIFSAIPFRFSKLNPTSFNFYFFAILAMLPNFLITDTEHFLFSTPLIIWILTQLKMLRSQKLNIIFTMIVFLYAVHSQDLWGKTLANQLNFYGILGLGNLLIIGFGSYLLWKNNTIPLNHSSSNS